MPTFFVWSRACEDESFWIYGIDDWDARAQLVATLGIDAHDEAAYGCAEDDRVHSPLNLILHRSGERTEVPEPPQLRAARLRGCGEEC